VKGRKERIDGILINAREALRDKCRSAKSKGRPQLRLTEGEDMMGRSPWMDGSGGDMMLLVRNQE